MMEPSPLMLAIERGFDISFRKSAAPEGAVLLTIDDWGQGRHASFAVPLWAFGVEEALTIHVQIALRALDELVVVDAPLDARKGGPTEVV